MYINYDVSSMCFCWLFLSVGVKLNSKPNVRKSVVENALAGVLYLVASFKPTA